MSDAYDEEDPRPRRRQPRPEEEQDSADDSGSDSEVLPPEAEPELELPETPPGPPPKPAPKSPRPPSGAPSRSAARSTRKSADGADKGAGVKKSARGKAKSTGKKAPTVDRGKWRGGTPRQRLQRVIWVFYQLYRFAPILLIVLIALAVIVPNVLRMTQKPPVIAPFYTPEVQYWGGQISKWSVQYGVNADLIATLMQIESCGYPGAASNAGAQGLFQVMPMHFGTTENMTDPETNALRGIGVIKECLHYADGDIGLAMACYNGGPSLISRNPLNWPTESKNYYTWGVGIYNDAVTGKQTSASLQDWLQAGGVDLCRKAAVVLGLPTPTEGIATAAPTAILPTVTPRLPTAPVQIDRQPTGQPFPTNSSTLPTFSLELTDTPTPVRDVPGGGVSDSGGP